jgi:hypothetical protein
MAERYDPKAVGLPAQLSNFLYVNALEAKKRLKAWKATTSKLKSVEYQRTVLFVKQELSRINEMQSVLRPTKAEKSPEWIVPLLRSVAGQLEERLRENEALLRHIQRLLEDLSEICRLGRSDLASYLLWEFKVSLRAEIRNTPYSRSLSVILAAFAHASELVPPESDDGDYVATIKNRLNRLQDSKKKKLILHLLFQQTRMQWRASMRLRAKVRKHRNATATGSP